MDSYKTIIKEAELLAASPEFVAEFLRSRADQSNAERRNDQVSEEVERALRSRVHPLIDLALARYSRYYLTVRPLFEEAPPGHAIRLAILSNTCIGTASLNQFPVAGPIGSGLFHDDQEAVGWLKQAPLEEIHALFQNPTLSDSFLHDVLCRSTPWNDISDEKLLPIVGSLASNPRMRTLRQLREFVDGYSEYIHHSVFDAAWKLAETVEPNESWAMVLGWLYEQLPPESSTLRQPLQLAPRWQSNISSDDMTKKEADENAWGVLSNKQRVRKVLGRLALSEKSDILPDLLNSGDVALRCAAYAYGELKPEQMTAAYENDGELVFEQAKNNTNIWQSAATREALKSLAWSIAEKRDSSHWLEAGIYDDMHEEMQRQHVESFKDEEDDEKEMDDDPTQVDKLEYATNVEESKAAQHLGKIFMRSICVAVVLVLGTEASHRLLGFPSDTKFVPITALVCTVLFIVSTYWTTILQSRALRLNEFRIRFRQIDRHLMEIEARIESGKSVDKPKDRAR